MSPKERFSLLAHTSFLQFVTSFPDLNKGWVKGHVLVFSPWSDSIERSNQPFNPNGSLELPSIISFYIACFVTIALNGFFEQITNIFPYKQREV